MIARSYALESPTRGDDDIVDVTDRIQEAVRESGVEIGQATVMVVGSTAAQRPDEGFETALLTARTRF